jgi:hypothetical protein
VRRRRGAPPCAVSPVVEMRIAKHVGIAAAGCALLLLGAGGLLSMRYAAGRLDAVRGRRGSPTAEAGMRTALLDRYPGAEVQIVGSGNDAPGLRFVVARFRLPASGEGANASPGQPWQEAGWYFLKMDQGWVYIDEDELGGPALAVGKWLLDRLQGGRGR